MYRTQKKRACGNAVSNSFKKRKSILNDNDKRSTVTTDLSLFSRPRQKKSNDFVGVAVPLPSKQHSLSVKDDSIRLKQFTAYSLVPSCKSKPVVKPRMFPTALSTSTKRNFDSKLPLMSRERVGVISSAKWPTTQTAAQLPAPLKSWNSGDTKTLPDCPSEGAPIWAYNRIFGNAGALRDVDTAFRANGSICIVGPPGIGKSFAVSHAAKYFGPFHEVEEVQLDEKGGAVTAANRLFDLTQSPPIFGRKRLILLDGLDFFGQEGAEKSASLRYGKAASRSAPRSLVKVLKTFPSHKSMVLVLVANTIPKGWSAVRDACDISARFYPLNDKDMLLVLVRWLAQMNLNDDFKAAMKPLSDMVKCALDGGRLSGFPKSFSASTVSLRIAIQNRLIEDSGGDARALRKRLSFLICRPLISSFGTETEFERNKRLGMIARGLFDSLAANDFSVGASHCGQGTFPLLKYLLGGKCTLKRNFLDVDDALQHGGMQGPSDLRFLAERLDNEWGRFPKEVLNAPTSALLNESASTLCSQLKKKALTKQILSQMRAMKDVATRCDDLSMMDLACGRRGSAPLSLKSAEVFLGAACLSPASDHYYLSKASQAKVEPLRPVFREQTEFLDICRSAVQRYRNSFSGTVLRNSDGDVMSNYSMLRNSSAFDLVELLSPQLSALCLPKFPFQGETYKDWKNHDN